MSDETIFSLKDVSDLPKPLQESLLKFKSDDFTDKILKLFYLAQNSGKDILTLDEITVAYYRSYKPTKKRIQLHVKIYNMCKKGLLAAKKGKKGQYYLPKKGTNK